MIVLSVYKPHVVHPVLQFTVARHHNIFGLIHAMQTMLRGIDRIELSDGTRRVLFPHGSSSRFNTLRAIGERNKL